jgi:hypothetical protein
MKEEKEVVQLSLFACTNCQRGHRKCDRGKPICGQCKRTQKACIYDKKHRNNRSSIDIKQYIIDTPTSTQHDMNRLSLVLRHTNPSFESLTCILPLMNVCRVMDVLSYFSDFTVTGKEEDALVEKPSSIEFALALSNAGFSHLISGGRIMAQNMIKEAKKAVIDIIDLGACRSDAASCCAYFGAYYAYDADPERTRFYLNQVHTFLDSCGSTHPLSRILEPLCYACHAYIAEDLDLEKLFFQAAAAVSGHTVTSPPLLDLEKIDYFKSMYSQLLDSVTGEEDMFFKRNVLNLLTLGAKLQYLSCIGLDLAPITLQLADMVIPAIEAFELAPSTWQIQAELCKLTELASLSSMIMKIHSPFINNVASMIQVYEVKMSQSVIIQEI